MAVAVVDAVTFKVINTIVATPFDAPYDGSYLISIPQGMGVDKDRKSTRLNSSH